MHSSPCPTPVRPWRCPPASSSRRTRLWRSFRPQAAVPSASPSQAEVLVLDGTNILSRRPGGGSLKAAFADWLAFLQLLVQPQLVVACFDAPKGEVAAPGERQALDQGYLQRRWRQAAQRRGSGGGGGLYPALQLLQEQGALAVVAQPGWEADDAVGAVCAVAHDSLPELRIMVASGDTDMQQLLSPHVSWLHLLPAPNLQHPLGVEVVTAEGFERQQGFPPGAYADWLALVGKKGSSVGGLGTGASTAAKVLKRYGSIEGVQGAAHRGELAGWSAAVQRLFPAPDGGAAGTAAGGAESQQLQAALQRNRRLFTINRSPEMLGEQQREQILQRVGHLATTSSGGGGGGSGGGSGSGVAAQLLAWGHPLHAARWRQIQQAAESLEEQLRARGAAVEVQSVTPAGLAVDLMVSLSASGAQMLLEGGDSPIAVILAGPGEVGAPAGAADGWTGGALDFAAAVAASGAVARQLRPAMQQHVRLLKKEGLRVVCLPWGSVTPP